MQLLKCPQAVHSNSYGSFGGTRLFRATWQVSISLLNQKSLVRGTQQAMSIRCGHCVPVYVDQMTTVGHMRWQLNSWAFPAAFYRAN